jgi:hypothetical protein
MNTDRQASNYTGKSGKTNVQMQGQTEGVYGSTVDITRREPHPPTDLKP